MTAERRGGGGGGSQDGKASGEQHDTVDDGDERPSIAAGAGANANGKDALTAAVYRASDVVPWWALIVGAAAAVRAIGVPPQLYQARHARRFERAAAEIKEAQQLVLATPGANTLQKVASFRRLRKVALAKQDTAMWKVATPWSRLATTPLFVATAVKIRQLAQSGDLTGGLPTVAGHPAWITDLSVPDPLYVLPAVNTALLLLNIELAGRPQEHAGEQSRQRDGHAAPSATSAAESPSAGSSQNSTAAAAAAATATTTMARLEHLLMSPRIQDGVKSVLQGAVLLIAPGVATLPAAVTLFWCANTSLNTAFNIYTQRRRRRQRRKQHEHGAESHVARHAGDTPDVVAVASGERPATIKNELSHALQIASRELQDVQRRVNRMVGARRASPALLSEVEQMLASMRAAGRLHVPLHAEMRHDESSGEPYIAILMRHEARS